MLRDPNSEGLTADWLPSTGKKDPALTRGREWIEKAKHSIIEGRWPEANPNDDEHKAIRLRFGDGQTREKYAEVFDYSGELLNPQLSDTERAAKLRYLLGEMDGLMVIAEHPLFVHDISKVEKDLNGLLQSFALLVNEKKTRKESAQVPIALVVNKWDRSEHFDHQGDSARQTSLLEGKYLKSIPPPFHVAVANALRPAASSGHFKMFAVSAMGHVERLDDKELPPKGKLHSLGVEDPFFWLIRQIDQFELASLDSKLKTKWVFPWPFQRREIARLKGRIAKGTPERTALNRLSRKSWLQFACGLFIWLGVVPSLFDGWQHHRAETAITDPKGDWQVGTTWMREYSNSNPANHLIYKRIFSISEASERARLVTEEKDDDAFAAIPNLSTDKPGLLDEADRLATDQLDTFPNSRHSDQRKKILEGVLRIRNELAFEKQLNVWRQEKDTALSDRVVEDRDKLKHIQTLEITISSSPDVPLDGGLRDQWLALLNDLERSRKQLVVKVTVGDGLEKIRQTLEADDYLKAATLLADWQHAQDAAYKELLNRFQTSIASTVDQKAEITSQQGAKWSDAVLEPELFLRPDRRSLLNDTNVESIQKTIHRVKMKGDEHFYETARKTRDNSTLSAYLNQAPLQSMANEVSQYLKWLDEREKPRNITFKLIKIKWAGSQKEKDWTGGGTKIFFSVNDRGDAREEDVIDEKRDNSAFFDSNGLRQVTLNAVRQVDVVRIKYNVWNLYNWGGSSEQIGWKNLETSPENLLAPQLEHTDSQDGKLTIEVEGVLPQPDLPTWREVP